MHKSLKKKYVQEKILIPISINIFKKIRKNLMNFLNGIKMNLIKELTLIIASLNMSKEKLKKIEISILFYFKKMKSILKKEKENKIIKMFIIKKKFENF
jgi:hypothetical protein